MGLRPGSRATTVVRPPALGLVVMVTDYNQNRIAEQYQQSKAHSWRSHAETYSFMKLIGDVEGKRVLDVACGEGHSRDCCATPVPLTWSGSTFPSG